MNGPTAMAKAEVCFYTVGGPGYAGCMSSFSAILPARVFSPVCEGLAAAFSLHFSVSPAFLLSLRDPLSLSIGGPRRIP